MHIMPSYRLYFFDSKGHVRQAIVLACANDDDANRASLQQADGRRMELWAGRSIIARFAGACPA
jgi:hypothetical protein